MTNVAFSQNMFRLGMAWAWLLLNNFCTILHLCARRSDAVPATTVCLFGLLGAIICKLARYEGSVSALGARERIVPADFFLLSLLRSSGPCSESPSRPEGESVIFTVLGTSGVLHLPIWSRSSFSPQMIGSQRFFYEILSCLKQLHCGGWCHSMFAHPGV